MGCFERWLERGGIPSALTATERASILRWDEPVPPARPRPIPDFVCEHRLRVALQRAGMTDQALAKLLGMSMNGLDAHLAYGEPGLRSRIEATLHLAPETLKFR